MAGRQFVPTRKGLPHAVTVAASFFHTGADAALAGTCSAQTPSRHRHQSYLTADISAKLSLAGTWTPIDAAGDRTDC